MDDFSCIDKSDAMSAAIQNQFGERVRKLRQASGRSQEAFAGLANIDRSTYGKLERGELNASLTTLARIAVALDVTLSILLADIILDPEHVRGLPRATRGPRPMGGREGEA